MSSVLAYLFYFVAASASPLQRRWLAVKKPTDSRSQVRFAFQVTSVVSLFSLLLPLFSPFRLLGHAWQIIGLSMVSGVFGGAVYITTYVAQKHVEAGVSSLLTNIYTPITIVLASIFLKEGLRLMQVLGTVLLLLGVIIVSKKHQTGRFTFDKYFWLMILSGTMLSVALIAERALIKTTGFTAGSMLSWGAQWATLGIALLVVKSNNTYSIKDIGITGVLRYLQTVSWVTLSFVVGNLSIVSAITTFKVVIIFIAAALLLKERENVGRKILGSVVAVVGLLFMK